MRKRSAKDSRLWMPVALGEPCLLTPGQLDYPSGLIGQPQPPPPSHAKGARRLPDFGSCQRWERAVLGPLIRQPLALLAEQTPHRAAEQYLCRVWASHRQHFGQSTRPAPGLELTDELRADTLAQYLPEPHLIKVRPSALTQHVLVHECCHAWTTQLHGKDFAAGMLYLMQHEFGCDRDKLLANAHDVGLHFTEESHGCQG